jgi:hemoglobin-like flavoprotein
MAEEGGGTAAAGPVARSLALLAERVGDPAPLVYARLFARHPEAEALFVMDRGGQVRGQMLAVALETLLELEAGGEAYATGVVAIERMNHVNIGVPVALFDGFYALLAEVVREALAEAWTPTIAEGWERCLARLSP